MILVGEALVSKTSEAAEMAIASSLGETVERMNVSVGSIDGIDTMLAEVEGTKNHQDASRLYHAEAAMVLRLAKVLRLGPRHDRTKPKLVPTGPRPWEGYDLEQPATRGGFEKEMAEAMAAKAKPKPESDGSPPAA